MSPEEKDRVRESNTESRRDVRAKMPPEEKGKEKEKRGRRVKEGKKMEQQFCRGHIYDDSRQLQTVWILENEKKKRTKKEANGGVKIVKKYVFREELDSVKSRFVLDPRKPNEEDQKFINDQIERGFRFKHAKGMKGNVGGGNYYRFGPWTRNPIQDSLVRTLSRGEEGTELDGVIRTDFPGEMILETSFTLGSMDYTCKYCGAKGFEGEVQNWYGKKEDRVVDFGCLCCKRGQVSGIRDFNLPSELDQLYTDQEDPTAKRFREKSRLFGNGMAMSSVTIEKGWKNRCYNNKMSSMLTASGQFFRRIGPMIHKAGRTPKAIQCWFFGPEEAATYRIRNAFGPPENAKSKKKEILDRTIFTKLHKILIKAKNKYIETFLSVKDYVAKRNVGDVVLALHANESTNNLIHKGRLNAPCVKEVAVLMPNEIGADHERLLTFNYKTPNDSVGLQFIPDYHRCYDPLQYPLIFPDGQDGWHFELKHTLLDHVNFMMMDRDGITNPILCGNGIGQQFILDQYCKVELERLRWVELNQKTIHAELYSGLTDSIKKSDNMQQNLKHTGRRVILPSTFIGGDRYMHQQYMDSMALFQHFGRPHLFDTMTANPQWKEIQDYLKPDQTAFDRPELVARVFKLKKQQLIREIHAQSIFGKCVARTHCIEFQKRGLPHVHILIWLETEKHADPTLIDKIICAEIPKATIEVPNEDNPGTFKDVTNPLFTKVTSSMLHGPCGHHNPSRSCTSAGSCKYNYPKDYIYRTELNEDGYPRYRRRSPQDGGEEYQTYRNNKKYTFTNSDVVPYSKYLTQRFDCHNNLEWCHSIGAIKYIFGYINKGSDQATVEIKVSTGDDWTETAEIVVENEVIDYKTKRYISTAEGCWRLQRNEVAERKPAVFRLNVHLPDQHTVYYNPDDCDIDNFEHKLEQSRTTPLTAFFDLNKRLKEKKKNETIEDTKKREVERDAVSKLLYRQIPEHYKWEKKSWKERKNETGNGANQISRIYSVSPIETERYSLRLLLNHVSGKDSFQDLRTVDGKVMPTFHAAAVALNLVKDDYIWIECMKEASETQTNINRLRSLFTTILLHCEVGSPSAFYDSCVSSLCIDRRHKYKEEFVNHPRLKHLVDGSAPLEDLANNDPSWTLERYAQNSCLINIQFLLAKENRTLEAFGLPVPDLEREQYIAVVLADDWLSSISDQTLELTQEKAELYFKENHPKLNMDQRHVFDTLTSLLEDYIEFEKNGKIPREKEGSLVFLDAPGGTGKTFTLNVLICWVIMKERLVAPTAASGIAATMLHNGRTAHNQFKIPINVTPDSTCNINEESNLALFLRKVLLIIIDEATMLDKWCYETLDRSMRELTDYKQTKFGGKIVLVSGDFRQLLEVIPGANRAKTVSRCLKGSDRLWDEHVIHLKLQENMRVKNAVAAHPDDEDFKRQLFDYEQWLLDLGEGKISSHQNIVEIPTRMCKDTKEDVIDAVFDDFEANIGNPQYYQSRAIVAATNEIVNEINNNMTERLPGELTTFNSIDTVGDDDNPTSFPSEFLNKLQLSGMAEHELFLKENSVVILLRNMDINAGHCNGTRYFVKTIGKYRLVLKKLSSEGNENDVLILPRIPMTSSAGTKLPFVLKRLQFPIKVAFALTINRSQGQTFAGKLGILLPRSVWTHGQLYVTFSRCGNPNNVFVWADQDEFKEFIHENKLQPGKYYSRNIVYKEVV